MLTAFYMFRLYFNIFWNKESNHHHNEHGEGTWSMKLPLIILAIASVLVGFVPFSHFVSSDGQGLESNLDLLFSIAPVSLAIIGISFAAYLYFKPSDKPEKLAQSLGAAFVWAKQKFYIDEIYLFVTKQILFNLVGRPAAWIDKNIVDGFYVLSALVTTEFSNTIKGWQSGNVQSYAIYFLSGILALSALLMYALN
jgi:NADH-quinone oxidoreductase subunit L